MVAYSSSATGESTFIWSLAEHGPGLLQELRGFSFAMPVAVHDGGAGGSAVEMPHCLKTGAIRHRNITPEPPLWSIAHGRPQARTGARSHVSDLVADGY